ncbi:hypothetical protein C8J57DRAFT_1282647 [Mycena rebaudengoi]|nr:hypothetical protein C8J57DRAFT_1282647 [Mycena rebaudengoi]
MPPSTNSKRPFQDITDRFLSRPVLPPSPTKRPQRKPGGALGEKLRLKATESRPFPSSLPPSSPPLYSSSSRGLPLDLGSEDEVLQEIHVENTGQDDNDLGFIIPSDDDADDDAENRAPANLSDPFGFFAVERKLKAERDVMPPPLLRHSRLTDDKERDDGLHMPSTPHKPKPGKRKLDPESASAASTPSPIKHRSPLGDSDDAELEELEPVLFALRAKGKAKEIEQDDSDAPKTKKPRRSESAEPEVVLPARRSTRVKTSKPVSKDDPKPKKRARKAVSTKTKGKKKAPDDDENDDTEKWERERIARLEYFRKLADYSIEKENVYVV